MKLDGPVEQYLAGKNPTHCTYENISKNVKAWDDDDVKRMLTNAGYLNENGKPTKLAAQKGIIDLCEKKVLWNILEVKKAMIIQEQIEYGKRAARNAAKEKKIVETGPKWVDLLTIGTYFGAGPVQVGKWLDQIGMREKPKIKKTSSGNIDMLDVARQKQDDQAKGKFGGGKVPSQKALDSGVARVKTVTGRKNKEFDIVEWNLELCKALLVKAGHKLDTERKMMLKGKGKNSDVKVNSIDDRAKVLYGEWLKKYNDPIWRDRAYEVFNGQPKPILVKVEALMNKPGYLTRKEYLKKR